MKLFDRSALTASVLGLLLAAHAPVLAQDAGAAQAPEEETMSPLEIDRALEGEPSWIVLEKGRIALERGDAGAALESFLEAKEAAARDVYPEADLALGDFWKAEGELAQAERSYRKALDDIRIAENLIAYKEFDYPQLRIVVLERLAGLYRLQENYGKMEEQYRAVVQADRDFTSGELADRIQDNFLASGLNKVLTLYRLESGFAVRAYAELGWLYYRNGLYEKAVTHLVYAVTNILSAALRELRRVDSEYVFASVDVTLRDAYRRPSSRAYLEETEIWRNLYYLAAASHAGNHPARARELWDLVRRWRESGEYQTLATRQLERPWIEPPLKEAFRSQTRSETR